MPLADELASRLEARYGRTRTVNHSAELIALCELLDEKLAQKIDRLPPRHVDNESKLTAMPKRRPRRKE
jgi:hypothetical protein